MHGVQWGSVCRAIVTGTGYGTWLVSCTLCLAVMISLRYSWCSVHAQEALSCLCVTSVDRCRTDGLVEKGAIVLTSKEWKEMTHDK